MLNNAQLNTLEHISYTLRKENIQWVVIGGLAAIAWGVKRPLADIDIQVKREDMFRVRELFKDNIATDVRHYQTERWDIYQMILKFDGVLVDVCQAEDFNVVKEGMKYSVPVTLNEAARLNVQGVSLPVMPKNFLIDYKRITGRQVDQEDLALLTK